MAAPGVRNFESLADRDDPTTTEASPEMIAEFLQTTSTIQATTTTLPPLPIAPAVDPLERFEVILVGDSLLVGAEQEVRLSLAPAQVTIDGEVGRGLPGSLQVFADLGQLVGEHDIVVIELGVNDFNFPDGYELMIAGTLSTLDHARCIIWVNTQEFTGHLPELNDAITRQTDRVENAFVADWASIADDPGLHLPDGYHLNEKGSRLLATLISSSVRNYCVPDESGSQ